MLVHRAKFLNLAVVETIGDLQRESQSISKLIAPETPLKWALKTIDLVEEMVRLNYFAFEIVESTVLRY